jgi:RNA polymerase sigma factor (TIGR02999 family)
MYVQAENSRTEVTQLLRAVRAGDQAALERVVPLVYDDLRRLARGRLRRERGAVTLVPTALVHEAYLKLAGAPLDAADRAHFLALASHAMRQVLVDHARQRRAAKRGGGWARTTLGGLAAAVGLDADELLALDDALAELEPRQREIVECRFFGGMEEREIAAALGVSDRTVRREWTKARAWLHHRLADAHPA